MTVSTVRKISFYLIVGSIILLVSLSDALAETPRLADRGLCAHRGDQGAAPENTVPAFVAAAQAGAQQVELDVQKTKDGKLVIMHDLTVDRTTDGKGKVKELTFDEIRALDAGIKRGPQFKGTKVPTLEEALDSLPDNIWINVHVKPGEGIAEDSVRLIQKKNRLHQAFLACNQKGMEAVRKICPSVKICCMERQKHTSDYVRKTIELKCDFIQLTGKYTKDDIAALKNAGVRINYFGTNSPARIRQMLKDGVEFPLVDRFTESWPVAQEFGIELNPVQKK